MGQKLCEPPDDILNLKRLRRVLRRLWFFHVHINLNHGTMTWTRKGLSPAIADRRSPAAEAPPPPHCPLTRAVGSAVPRSRSGGAPRRWCSASVVLRVGGAPRW